MTCTYDDGYEDARSRSGRDWCECEDYADGYAAGLRANQRDREARAEQEQQEYEAYMDALRDVAEREAYEEAMRVAYEAEQAASAPEGEQP